MSAIRSGADLLVHHYNTVTFIQVPAHPDDRWQYRVDLHQTRQSHCIQSRTEQADFKTSTYSEATSLTI